MRQNEKLIAWTIGGIICWYYFLNQVTRLERQLIRIKLRETEDILIELGQMISHLKVVNNEIKKYLKKDPKYNHQKNLYSSQYY